MLSLRNSVSGSDLPTRTSVAASISANMTPKTSAASATEFHETIISYPTLRFIIPSISVSASFAKIIPAPTPKMSDTAYVINVSIDIMTAMWRFSMPRIL